MASAARGYTGRMWRAAWLRQNGATNSPATDPLVLASPIAYSGGCRHDARDVPFSTPSHVSPPSCDSLRRPGEIDAIFTAAREQVPWRDRLPRHERPLRPDRHRHVPSRRWDYFISQIDMRASPLVGWKAPRSELLMARSGLVPQKGLGGTWTVNHPDRTGTLIPSTTDLMVHDVADGMTAVGVNTQIGWADTDNATRLAVLDRLCRRTGGVAPTRRRLGHPRGPARPVRRLVSGDARLHRRRRPRPQHQGPGRHHGHPGVAILWVHRRCPVWHRRSRKARRFHFRTESPYGCRNAELNYPGSGRARSTSSPSPSRDLHRHPSR